MAGVPALGVLVLSALVVLDVRQRAQAAAGFGSIENLAQLTEEILHLIDELQWERARGTYQAGGATPLGADLDAQERRTDAAIESLSQFLDKYDTTQLPAGLSHDLAAARESLRRLAAVRASVRSGDFVALDYIAYFSKANDSLIEATAALTQLSNDKQLLLSIGGLVSTMAVVERNAREHALLNYVFGKQEFPPGTFRYLVTLLTEREVYTASMQTWGSQNEFTRLSETLDGPYARDIAEMRRIAIETTEEAIQVDAKRWFETQNESMRALGLMEQELASNVRAIAAAEVEAARDAVRLAMGAVATIVGASLLLGWAITRQLTRSVNTLSHVARTVQEKNDFSLRAEKTSNDELGLLTEAFNAMMSGIQRRDRELDAHRQNLEALVEARTRQLSERNEEMQLVLDNIDQGLAMIDRDGKFLGECSRSFRETFGEPKPGAAFHDALVTDDERTRCQLDMGYQQLIEDVLPVELALAQMPRNVVFKGRHYRLSFTRIMRADEPSGALIVTRDVTDELLAERSKAEQHERVQIFERIVNDRSGFLEFIDEAGALVARVEQDRFADRTEKMRALHTLKGLAAMFDASTVAEAAHALEHIVIEGEDLLLAAGTHTLVEKWNSLLKVIKPIIGDTTQAHIELSFLELENLIRDVRNEVPHALIARSLARMTHDPVAPRFERLREQLLRTAKRLGKPKPIVRIETSCVRIPGAEFRDFWASLTHLVRNIADHGLQSESERLASGKAVHNQVDLSARSDEHGVYIEIRDDGRGIDWERIAARAEAKGIPARTRAELEAAIFADGVSTAECVTHTSGRGVGMSAVKAACSKLGGTIRIDSQRGAGTRFRFCFPPLAESADVPIRRDEEFFLH